MWDNILETLGMLALLAIGVVSVVLDRKEDRDKGTLHRH